MKQFPLWRLPLSGKAAGLKHLPVTSPPPSASLSGSLRLPDFRSHSPSILTAFPHAAGLLFRRLLSVSSQPLYIPCHPDSDVRAWGVYPPLASSSHLVVGIVLGCQTCVLMRYIWERFSVHLDRNQTFLSLKPMQFLPCDSSPTWNKWLLGAQGSRLLCSWGAPSPHGNCQPTIKSRWWSEWEMVTRE